MKQLRIAILAASNQLRSEIGLGPVLQQALATAYASDPGAGQPLIARARRMGYVNGIVSIYGLLEEYIDELLMEVVRCYERAYDTFGELPEVARGTHRRLVLQSLLDGAGARIRKPLDPAPAIATLSLADGDAFTSLAPTVVTYKTANYRHPLVCNMFQRIGIEVQSVFADNENLQPLLDSGLGFSTYESFLAELVRRRNDIAHSYKTEEQISADLVTKYLDIVTAYLLILERTANESLLAAVQKRALRLGKITKRADNFLALDMTEGTFALPFNILLTKEGGRPSAGSVASVQSKNISISTASHSGEMIPIGLKLVGKHPSNAEGCDAYVLPSEWSDLVEA